MGELVVYSIPERSRSDPRISSPHTVLHSPSLTPLPLLPSSSLKTTNHHESPCFINNFTQQTIVSIEDHVSQFNKVNPQDDWLPITASRKGNAYYSAFHTLNSGIGIQALMLPVAFTVLGWTWGIICFSLAFVWQLYTLWLLIQLHESFPGIRYSRYLHLSKAAFGEKLGKLLALLPIMYLSGGTCVSLVILASGSMKIFFQTVCGPTCNHPSPLTTIEWYLVFLCLAIAIAQLPNLNSVAMVSLIGAITAMGYCTLIWVISVSKTRPMDISYEPVKAKSDIARAFGILNALGIIAFAFRGHNLVLEIQGTMPSNEKQPSRVPMWRGVKFAYLIIAMCLVPIAVGGFWAYGNKIPNGGMVSALHTFHEHDTSRFALGLISLLVVIHSLSSFQIYAMPVFDNLAFVYTSKKNRPCPRWVRSGIRAFFGSVVFFIAVAIPFMASLAGLIGGIALPITLAYPCFMWILIKKPQRYDVMWFINWGLGCVGMALSVLVVAGGIWSIVDTGIKGHFFKP